MKNNVHKKYFIFLCSFALADLAHAETTSQTLCFVSLGKTQGKEELVLKTYFDNEIQEQVGAFLKRGKNNKTLLLYSGDGTSDESLDYELHWLEFVNGRIAGEYSLAKPRSATIQAAYIKYKNSKTRNLIIFGPSGKDDKDCVLQGP